MSLLLLFQGKAGTPVPPAIIGGHFIPLTRKQEQALQKKLRKERKEREAVWADKLQQNEAITSDIRSLLHPKPVLTAMAEITEDDEDEELELLLIHG